MFSHVGTLMYFSLFCYFCIGLNAGHWGGTKNRRKEKESAIILLSGAGY